MREETVVQVSKDSIDLGIIVTDEKAAVGFYRDALGLEWEGELALPGGRRLASHPARHSVHREFLSHHLLALGPECFRPGRIDCIGLHSDAGRFLVIDLGHVAILAVPTPDCFG